MRWSDTAPLLLLTLFSCGGGGDAPPAPPGGGSGGGAPSGPSPSEGGSEPAQDEGSQAYDASAHSASITGVAKFSGELPAAAAINMSSAPKCVEMNADGAADAAVLAGEGGVLQNVFVYVSKGHDGWTFETPGDPIMLDQVGCVYTPRVSGMMTGQALEVRNSDPVTHNVHTYAKKNKSLNKAQPAGSAVLKMDMKRGEVLIPVKCDMHEWMTAYVGVVDHPFFAVTGADGSFSLAALPAGEYTVSAQHEVFGKADKQTVTVGSGESKALEFTFSK